MSKTYCPSCKLSKRMMIPVGKKIAIVCGNRRCKSFKAL